MSLIRDSLGNTYTGCDAAGLAAFTQASREFQCYIDDPVASADRALSACPRMPMALALKAWLHLLGTEPAGLPVARACLADADPLTVNDRERGHLTAIGHLVEGRWYAAAQTLEDLSVAHPRDLLAIQAGHLLDFLVGDARMLRDRIARVLTAWDPAMPGHHAILGMHAFGLEECGDHTAAERAGRQAVEQEPRDAWAWHAVAHAMEMQDRAAEGTDWLSGGIAQWSPGSFFQVHLWWHLALFHLSRGDADAALALYDLHIAGRGLPQVLDLIDASALLWRLHLLGVDVGARWEPVADRWAAVVGDGTYAFNDWHALLAFIGSGRDTAQSAAVDLLRSTAAGRDDRAGFARIGLDAALASQAFAEQRWDDALALLRPLRSRAHGFGGSHAQRDLIDLTLIVAAQRSQAAAPLAAALVAERQVRRPTCALSGLFRRRLAAAASGAAGLHAA